jgi:hypothetical protein
MLLHFAPLVLVHFLNCLDDGWYPDLCKKYLTWMIGSWYLCFHAKGWFSTVLTVVVLILVHATVI